MKTIAQHTDIISEPPSRMESFMLWLKIGCISFGGPAAQIALMYRELVEEKKWINEKQYLNALNFCMLLPGPEAMQSATYVGWRLHGILGGLIAGLLFILPGAIVILLLAISYSFFSSQPLMDAIFLGVKAAVIVIVIDALRRLFKRALNETKHWVIAFLAFFGIFFFGMPYPLIILLAAAFGFFSAAKQSPPNNKLSRSNHSIQRSVRTALLGMLIWILPLLLLTITSGEPVITDISIFFSKLAVVTFGGAYSVLSYMAQDVVTQYQWLSADEMVDGLGLAETTPGPLILVTQFIAYLSAYHQGGLALGLVGALASLWATFTPCFIWIFVGAPYIDWLASQPRLQQALASITAAVTGVILNLSIWFALHVFFDHLDKKSIGIMTLWLPTFTSIDLTALGLTTLCALLLFVLKWGALRILITASILGIALRCNLAEWINI